MKKWIIAAAALCLISATASAQKMGSINRNAPTIKQSIEFGDKASIEMHYTAIAFGEGRWAKALADEGSRDGFRDRVNGAAAKTPLGAFKTSVELELGGQKIPAGDYKMGFMVGDKYQWQMVLMAGEKKMAFDLSLTKSPMESKRLVASLYAGEKDFTAGLYIAFGDQTVDLTMTPKVAQAGS